MLALLLIACTGGTVTVDKRDDSADPNTDDSAADDSAADDSAADDSEAPPCDAVGAVFFDTLSFSGFQWGGADALSWTSAATISEAPCEGFLLSASEAWLEGSLDGDTLTLSVLPEALVSGRHDARLEVRDLDHAELLATLDVHVDALVSPPSGGDRKALVVGIDGLDGEVVGDALTPALERLAEGGTWTHSATTQLTGDTNSGPGWTSLLTGVEVERHGVTYNGGYEGRDTAYPSFLDRLRDTQGLATAASIQWTPIYEILEDDAADQAWSGSMAEVADQMAGGLRSGLYDVHFVHLDDVDGAGHASGFVATSSQYIAAIEQADAHVGELLDAILDRSRVADEEWLIIVATDHGGTSGGSHGCTTSDCQTIPLWVAGATVPKVELPSGQGSHLDVHPTVIDFFGLSTEDYTLDGERLGVLRERDCEDGVDEDQDGLTDCDDPDCEAAEACWACAPDPLSGVGTAIATGINPTDNHLAGSCGGGDGAEAIYSWTAPADGWYAFDTMNCYRDTVLYLRDGGCEGAELACNDQPSSSARSVVAAELVAGQEIAVIVDSDSGASGETCLAAYPFSESCPDGALNPGLDSTSSVFAHADVVYAGSCPPAVGVLWQTWEAPADGRYTFSTAGSSFDTVLYLLDGCGGAELGCNDDSSGLTSSVSVTLSEGQSVAVGVGSFAGRESSGSWTVSVSQ